jgi:sarcosine oxidase subunit beta
MKTEIVIIGGGIVGSATAFYLARQGHQVILVEKEAGPGLQASGRAAGGVRQQGRRGALPLAIEAVQLWGGLAEDLDAELEYRRTGNLSMAVDQEGVAMLEAKTAYEQAHGLHDVEMISGDACRDMIPGLTDQVIAGKLCASDGSANPMLVTPAFARAAQRHGAIILAKTRVDGLLQQGSRVVGVNTSAGEIEAEMVINAAGAWAPALNAILGCVTPITPGRSQLMITEKLPPRVGPFSSVQGRCYFLQVTSGNLVIGINGVPNEAYEQHTDFPSLQQHAAYMIDVLPWMRDVTLIRAMAGITEYTPDGEPYIGAIPGVTGYLVAAGFHGQGFCVGPMAGKILAELIAGRESPVSLDPFRPDRLASQEEQAAAPPDGSEHDSAEASERH